MDELWKQITKVSEGKERTREKRAWLSSNPFSNLNNRKFSVGCLGTYGELWVIGAFRIPCLQKPMTLKTKLLIWVDFDHFWKEQHFLG